VPALLALEKLLGEVGTNLFRIKYLEEDWHSEIFASAEQTVARVRQLCAPTFEPLRTERFHVEAQDPAILFSQARRAEGFGPMAMKWRVAFGNFDNSVVGFAGRKDLLPLLAITSVPKKGGQPIWRFLGGAHRWGGDAYRMEGIGRPIEAMPDREY